MPSTFCRVGFPRAGHPADAGIIPRYPAELAAWIWHPERLAGTSFLRFSLEFETFAEEEIEFQVSADQRFQLSIDGEEFGFGPDRSDVGHWSVQSYRGTLAAGRHSIRALVWWIADPAFGSPTPDCTVRPPMAQASFRGGFLLAESNGASPRLNTGFAPWKVEDLTAAVSLEKIPFESYHDIGPSFCIDAEKWTQTTEASVPVVVRKPVVAGNPTGVARPGWRLESTLLPEQLRSEFSGGTIRSSDDGSWQELVSNAKPLRIASGESVTVLWDLGCYICGYPSLRTSGGRSTSIAIEWAEALYESPDVSQPIEASTPKGHRDEIEGKQFFGFGDRYICSGEDGFDFPAFWWRSGRFLRVRVETANEAVVIERLGIRTTRYPLECESRFEGGDRSLERIADLAANTMLQGTHEIFTDSPYYEQMAYVGDNVLAALVSYVLTRDTRIVQRSIELFDWSRSVSGLVAERWPCARYQGSSTYAMLWPSMVWNHALWKDETGFVRERIHGVRQLIEELTRYLGPDGLLHQLPGWLFVDWVPDWVEGCPPGHQEGDSSIVHLHWLLCLRAAAELERYFGDEELRQRFLRLENRASAAIKSRYWCPERELFLDDGRGSLSEHANILATLSGLSLAPDWPEKLAGERHARCTVYFTHYLFEAFARMRRADLLFSRLDLWRSFLHLGLHTIPEQPEPTRSDCHAWGAHPLFHLHATVAGIRPGGPGFQTVRIRPMPGNLKYIKGSLPHPKGTIYYDLNFGPEETKGEICLPENISGILECPTGSRLLASGKNAL